MGNRRYDRPRRLLSQDVSSLVGIVDKVGWIALAISDLHRCDRQLELWDVLLKVAAQSGVVEVVPPCLLRGSHVVKTIFLALSGQRLFTCRRATGVERLHVDGVVRVSRVDWSLASVQPLLCDDWCGVKESAQHSET
jgi:hypothetical protein